MNKTLAEIIADMMTAKNNNAELDGLTTTSKTAIWRQILETVAFVIWNFQELCRTYLEEIQMLIKQQKVPTLRWYRNEALKYQDGFALVYNENNYTISFSDHYENNGVPILATDEKIEASKVVKYCSVTKSKTDSKILMKVASEVDGEIVPLTEAQGEGFKFYVSEFAAAGDHITIVNYKSDILYLKYDICYDPLVLNANGMHKITARYPVVDAIQKYLKNLDFNAELSVSKLEEIILATEGVTDLLRKSVSSSWIDVGSGDYGYPQPVNIAKIPKSGHWKIEDWSGINYIIKEPQE